MPTNKKNEQADLMTIENGQSPTVEMMIMHAIDKYGPEGAESGVAIMEKLIAMKRDQERWDAEKEFYRQLKEFRKACPTIKKTANTGGVSNKGGSFGFSYAPLDEVEQTVKKPLYEHGFSYYWTGEVFFEDGKPFRKETVWLLHENGHKIPSSAVVPISGDIGKMNDIQKFGTGSSYAKRYALLSVLGMAPSELPDTDGAEPSEKLTPEQVETVQKAMHDAMPPSSQDRLLKLLKVSKVEELAQSDLENVMRMIAEKKKKFQEA